MTKSPENGIKSNIQLFSFFVAFASHQSKGRLLKKAIQLSLITLLESQKLGITFELVKDLL